MPSNWVIGLYLQEYLMLNIMAKDKVERGFFGNTTGDDRLDYPAPTQQELESWSNQIKAQSGKNNY